MDYGRTFDSQRYLIQGLEKIAMGHGMRYFHSDNYERYVTNLEGCFFSPGKGESIYVKIDLDKVIDLDLTLKMINHDLYSKRKKIPNLPKYDRNHITKLGDLEKIKINNVIFNDPATIVQRL